jgi:hypothetical protein
VKIEQLIVQHLYNSKQVTLQGIGTIHLNPSVSFPSEGDKDFVMPENALSFDYDLKAKEDDSLIAFIVEKTRKIKPLATADLESFSILSKQFLNIGKPLVIEGVGTIQKSQQGDYEFKPGNFITPKIDDVPKQLREKRDETVSFESEGKPDNSRRNLLIVAAVLIAVLAGMSAYYFISNKRVSSAGAGISSQQIEVPIVDSVKKDSTAKITTDTSKQLPAQTITTDSNNFKIVIKEYTTLATATKAFNRLIEYGHKVELITVDSAHYRLAMGFAKPLSDTFQVKDSLRIFFGGKPFVLLK